MVKIEHFGHLSSELKKIGCKLHHYRKNVNLYNFERGYELEIDREHFPKEATVEQMQWLYELAVQMNEEHPVVNKRFKWH